MQKLNIEYARNDERGSLVQINTGEWKQANYLSINKGYSFGGHYHRHKKELFYLISGRVKVFIEGTGKMHELDISENELFLVEPFEKHTIEAKENSVILEMLSQPYSKEDTYVKDIIST